MLKAECTGTYTMLNSITAAQECDATDDDSSNADDNIKKLQ